MLDEPLNGLDPLVRAETIELFRESAARGPPRHPLQPRPAGSGRHLRPGDPDRQRHDRGRGRDPQRARGDARAPQPVPAALPATPSRVASLLFLEDHVTEVRLSEDRQGLLVLTRSREAFSRGADAHRAGRPPYRERGARRRERGRALQVPDRRRTMITAQRLRQALDAGPAGGAAGILLQAGTLGLSAGALPGGDLLRARAGRQDAERPLHRHAASLRPRFWIRSAKAMSDAEVMSRLGKPAQRCRL